MLHPWGVVGPLEEGGEEESYDRSGPLPSLFNDPQDSGEWGGDEDTLLSEEELELIEPEEKPGVFQRMGGMFKGKKGKE